VKKRWLPKLKSDVEELTAALVDAQVDLNPHQIDAAPKLKEKLAGEKQVKVLEAQRNQKRRSLFDAQVEH
jgi:adenine-specific DNA-methyltransferase